MSWDPAALIEELQGVGYEAAPMPDGADPARPETVTRIAFGPEADGSVVRGIPRGWITPTAAHPWGGPTIGAVDVVLEPGVLPMYAFPGISWESEPIEKRDDEQVWRTLGLPHERFSALVQGLHDQLA